MIPCRGVIPRCVILRYRRSAISIVEHMTVYSVVLCCDILVNVIMRGVVRLTLDCSQISP